MGYAVRFKIAGTYSTDVPDARNKSEALAHALGRFLNLSNEIKSGRIQLAPAEDMGLTPEVLAKASSFVEGMEPIDWRGVDDALAILEGELGKHAKVARVLHVIQAAVHVAKTYPEDAAFCARLKELRGGKP